MNFAEALAAAKQRPLDEDLLDTLARCAMAEGDEEEALELLAGGARQTDSAHLWHWVGVLQRALGDHVQAFASLSEAQRLDPTNRAVVHALARTAFEAGWDSVDRFEQAARMGPPDGAILLGLASARFARGEGERAAEEIEEIVRQVPHWFDGHRQLGQLRALLGQRERATESLESALKESPADKGLWLALLDQNIAASDFAALDDNIARARTAGLQESLDAYEAIAAGELGDIERADRLFRMPAAPAIWHIRHLLRNGRAKDALPIIDSELASADPLPAWPYALAAWREVDEDRYRWLVGSGGFVEIFDLAGDLPPIDRLTEVIGGLHNAKGEFLDQSVRGGTQTDGPLFSRTEPEIRALRAAVEAAVKQYVSALPERDPAHPLLGPRRDRAPRFAGSWSVRLRGSGFHESHVHPRGWISSALYLALPGGDEGKAEEQGVLELGAPPRSLNLHQSPIREIDPRVGRLVLFPSWLWHGTRPFQSGERLTIAFDVKVSH